MKKILLSLGAICAFPMLFIAGCQKDNDVKVASQYDFYRGNVHVIVKEDAPLLTKTLDNDLLYTVTAYLNSEEYSMYAIVTKEDGFVKETCYTQDYLKFATFVSYEGKYINVEFYSDIDNEEFDTKAGGFRERGEKYAACVRRVKSSLEEAIREKGINDAVCEFINYCGTVSAACAIIGCGDYI